MSSNNRRVWTTTVDYTPGQCSLTFGSGLINFYEPVALREVSAYWRTSCPETTFAPSFDKVLCRCGLFPALVYARSETGSILLSPGVATRYDRCGAVKSHRFYPCKLLNSPQIRANMVEGVLLRITFGTIPPAMSHQPSKKGQRCRTACPQEAAEQRSETIISWSTNPHSRRS